ncbi:MAG: O-antigen ligase family protein [Clostridiales bacterium]|nr:O-antigen ligase family protein [Clostridiales bacterium]
MQQVKDKLSYIRGKAAAFIESDKFIYLVAAIVLSFSLLGWDLAGFYVLILLCSFILCSNLDIRATTPIIIMMCFVLSIQNSPLRDTSASYFLSTTSLVSLSVLAAVLLTSMVYGAIKRGLRVRLTLNFWGVFALVPAFVFGGIFYKGYSAASMLVGLVMSLYFFGAFVYFSLYIKRGDFDFIAKTILVLSLIGSVQLGVLYLTSDWLRQTLDKGAIMIGWGNSNSIAIMLVIGMPPALYYAAKSKHPVLFFVLTCVLAAATVFTYSRAALLFAVPICVGGTVYAVFKQRGRGRIGLLIAGGALVAAFIGFVGVKWNLFVRAMDFYIQTGIDDRGRYELLVEAFNKFLSAPLFGVGAYDSVGVAQTYIFFYHNMFFQFLAWSGIFGFVMYSGHLVTMFLTGIKHPAEKRTFLLLVILAATGHSMLDCVLYYPYLTFVYMLCLAYADRDLTADADK